MTKWSDVKYTNNTTNHALTGKLWVFHCILETKDIILAKPYYAGSV